jgi:hypothetical protein
MIMSVTLECVHFHFPSPTHDAVPHGIMARLRNGTPKSAEVQR